MSCIVLDYISTFFCMQVIKMLFWGELNSSLQVTFWIEFDLIFAFFYMQVITIVFCIVLDFILTFFCKQVITMVFWTVLYSLFTRYK